MPCKGPASHLTEASSCPTEPISIFICLCQSHTAWLSQVFREHLIPSGTAGYSCAIQQADAIISGHFPQPVDGLQPSFNRGRAFTLRCDVRMSLFPVCLHMVVPGSGLGVPGACLPTRDCLVTSEPAPAGCPPHARDANFDASWL